VGGSHILFQWLKAWKFTYYLKIDAVSFYETLVTTFGMTKPTSMAVLEGDQILPSALGFPKRIKIQLKKGITKYS
jgi:hypothetical protein